MPTIPRMRCPECGVEMNPHAVKLIEPVDADDLAKVDPALGGVAREVHTCPACGDTAARDAMPPAR